MDILVKFTTRSLQRDIEDAMYLKCLCESSSDMLFSCKKLVRSCRRPFDDDLVDRLRGPGMKILWIS